MKNGSSPTLPKKVRGLVLYPKLEKSSTGRIDSLSIFYDVWSKHPVTFFSMVGIDHVSTPPSSLRLMGKAINMHPSRGAENPRYGSIWGFVSLAGEDELTLLRKKENALHGQFQKCFCKGEKSF